MFDNYFVMQDWYNNKIYKQSYAVDGEDVSLDGDRVEVFEILVTKEEKDALDALKENYSALEIKYNELKEFKDNYDAAELKAALSVPGRTFDPYLPGFAVVCTGEEVLIAEADDNMISELGVSASFPNIFEAKPFIKRMQLWKD